MLNSHSSVSGTPTIDQSANGPSSEPGGVDLPNIPRDECAHGPAPFPSLDEIAIDAYLESHVRPLYRDEPVETAGTSRIVSYDVVAGVASVLLLGLQTLKQDADRKARVPSIKLFTASVHAAAYVMQIPPFNQLTHQQIATWLDIDERHFRILVQRHAQRFNQAVPNAKRKPAT